MEEIFELIRAFNRLKDKVMELCTKMDLVLKLPAEPPPGDYIEEHFACKLMRISRSTLVRLRNTNSIPFIKLNRKVLYRKSDLDEILLKQTRGFRSGE